MEDNRHQVPTNSCCSSGRNWSGGEREVQKKKGGGGKEERKTVPLAQGSDVHLSTFFSQLSPV